CALLSTGRSNRPDSHFFTVPGSPPEAVRMIYFNSDGSRAAMCGNAALCSTRLAARLGLATSQRMTLETDAATYESRCAPSSDGEGAELHLAPVQAPRAVPGLTTAAGARKAVR